MRRGHDEIDGRMILLIALLMALLAAGCGTVADATQMRLDAANTAATVLYGLIQAQAVTGTVPETMTEAEFAAAVERAGVAYAQVAAAYADGLTALSAGNRPAADASAARMLAPLATLASVKAAVCPFMHKAEEKPDA